MMSGAGETANTRTGPATTFAVASGAEMPRNCGSSSPKTIENTVAISRASAGGHGVDGRRRRQPRRLQRAAEQRARATGSRGSRRRAWSG